MLLTVVPSRRWRLRRALRAIKDRAEGILRLDARCCWWRCSACFIARDLLLFYVFFELTLIPMFFIIGIWGGPERRYAAGKFFLFTFTGSVFTLAGVVYLGMQGGHV